ncbi:hypothetical protein SAMN03159434_109188 [Enterobacter sp. NFR05]|nr:hypothetical protein SAMN03159434_109188 [Enterobacter sp. NFR05]
MTTQLPSINETIYRLANHIAGAKGGLPAEWQDWADEIETDLRTLLAAYEQEPVSFDELRDAVAEMTGVSPMEWREGDSKGHQEVPFINFNSLSRIVEKFRTHPAPSIPAVPDGYVLMPMKLTAENGAKYALSGEFHVLHRVTCHECGGEGCSDCDDDGWLEEKIMIGWDDIKDIYRAAVQTCSIKSTGEGV